MSSGGFSCDDRGERIEEEDDDDEEGGGEGEGEGASVFEETLPTRTDFDPRGLFDSC